MGGLVESADLLRGAVDASPNGMIISDAQGKVVLANREVERMFGYAHGELVGRPLEDLLPARYRAAHVGHITSFMAKPSPRPLGKGREFYALHKTGREFAVEIGLAPLQRGADSFVIASVADITERRRAQEHLRWLSLAVEQGPASVVMTDVAGNIEYVNAKFTEVTGYTLDEVRGQNPRILKGGITPPEVYRDLWTSILAGKWWHGEIRNKKKDGSTYWDSMWVYPVRDEGGSVTRFLALKEDITERKRAEDAVRESEAYHRSIFESIGDAVFIVDAAGRYLEANARACELTGYAREDLLGLCVPDTYPVDQRGEAAVRVQAAAHGTPQVYERELLRADGKGLIVEVNARPLPGGRIVATLRDITERRTLERQLRQAQKMEAVGQLASGVAHDFNNLLTAIFGYAEFAADELPPDSPIRDDIEEIRKAAQRASTVTRQLLAFSRQQVLEPVIVNPNEMVEDVTKMLRRLIGEDVELRTVLAGDLGNVRADVGQLQQVLVNLAVNARDAMPRGGTLLIETSNADLAEEYAEQHRPTIPGRYVMLAVSDTGTGMSAETKSRIFEPFYTTKEKG